MRVLRVLCALASVPAALPAAAAGSGGGREQFDQRLAGCANPEDCSGRAALIAIQEPEGTPLQSMAQEYAVANMSLAKTALLGAFPAAPDEQKVRIYGLLDLGWANLHQGTDFLLSDLVVRGFLSDAPDVRLAAARVAARHPLRAVSHFFVDATEIDPRLTIYALRALELNQDALLARWVVQQLGSSDPATRGQAQRTLYVFGRRALTALSEQLAAADAASRRLGVEGLLVVAGPDDLPTLRSWLEAHGEDDQRLAERVVRAIAELEAGTYRFPLPTAPALS